VNTDSSISTGRGRKHFMLYWESNLFLQNSNKTLFEIYYLRKPNIFYFKIFGCICFVLNTKDSLGKFDPKSFEAIFVAYSNTSKSYRVFNKSILTIEESMHVKFEKSNSLVKNVIEIDCLGENYEKISMIDLLAQKRRMTRKRIIRKRMILMAKIITLKWSQLNHF